MTNSHGPINAQIPANSTTAGDAVSVGRVVRFEWKVRGTRGAGVGLVGTFSNAAATPGDGSLENTVTSPRKRSQTRFPGTRVVGSDARARVFEFRFTFQPTTGVNS